MRELLRVNLVLTTEEIKENLHLNISRRTVSNLIKKANLSRKAVKKINFNNFSNKNLKLQLEYFNKIMNIPFENIIYLDETGFNRHIIEKYGYSPVGVDCHVPVKGSKGNSITLISAISLAGLVYYTLFEGACNRKIFIDFLITNLIPRIQTERCIIVMDNLSSHHAAVNNLSSNPNIQFVFLPPYCPEFYPI